jgi:PAS domain-containing protein
MTQAATASKLQAPAETASDGTAIQPVHASDTGTTSRAAIQTWTGKAIAEQIHGKPLSEAYRHWLYHRASRQPQLRDMYSKSFTAYGDILLNLKIGDEHVVVSQSDSYIRNIGQDLRGARLSELRFATANSLREIYNQCLATRQPIYARYISSLSDQNVYWEVLVLPLSMNERSTPIFTMSFVSLLSEKIDVLQILYERSPVGIVAAVPIMNGENKTDDARILTMNAKARNILRQDPSRFQIHTIGELIRYLSEGLSWVPVKSGMEGQVTRIDYRDPDGNLFSVSIEFVSQIVLISLAELGHPDAPQTEEPPEAKTAGRFARMLGLS